MAVHSESPATPAPYAVPIACWSISSRSGKPASVAWTSCWPLQIKENQMPVVEIRKDPQKLTMTVVAQLAAPVTRVWAAYADPRQLERFWAPPAWPAKFVRHDFVAGGRSAYHMTG